jgi:hypothetical protein
VKKETGLAHNMFFRFYGLREIKGKREIPG